MAGQWLVSKWIVSISFGKQGSNLLGPDRNYNVCWTSKGLYVISHIIYEELVSIHQPFLTLI